MPTQSFAERIEPHPLDQEFALDQFRNKLLAWETAVRLAARLSLAEQNKEILHSEAIEVYVEFHLGNNRRVDLDNLVKAVFDGMKGEAFRDDCQVVTLLAKKGVDATFQGVHIAVMIRR